MVLSKAKKRILIVDDNPAIHKDFHKIFDVTDDIAELEEVEANLFSIPVQELIPVECYEIDSAYQGQAALDKVKKSMETNERYALGFIDARMPPGWDGIDTIQRIWEVDPDIQIVICTAFADYTWKEISRKLHQSDNFLILKKPFDINEIRQLVAALTKKWELRKEVQFQVDNLKKQIEDKTAYLEEIISLTKATLESTPEGMIVVTRDRKISIYNKVFLKMWGIDEEIVKHSDAVYLFEQLSKRVNDSELFLKTMNQLCENPMEENIVNEWKLDTGSILRLYPKPHYLYDTVIGCVFCFRDVTEQKILEEQLLHQATHDSLTALPNRILLMDRLEQGIAYAKRNKNYLGVLLIDLDNFKDINDTLGHSVGDILLKLVADRLTKMLRDIDTVIRYGGDEFVVILSSQVLPEDVISKTKELLNIFLMPFQIEDHTVTVSFSVGISYYPIDGKNPDILLKNADAALYHAKKIGKNTFQVYLPEFNEQLLKRKELNNALMDALLKNEFILHYQPLFQLEKKKMIGFEALLRWNHPRLGIIYPESFISLAEETGLIVPIGEWVMREACKQLKIWQDRYHSTLFLSVNVANHQFIQKNFFTIVKNILNETKIVPRSLELELTESIAFRDVASTLKKLNQIKKLGVTVSIDDFGMGDFSFAYLKYFPCDKIKIDKSFIKGVNANKFDAAIVEAIIEMANKMGIQVLAEGVENEEQVKFLLKHHGNQVQGYYFSKPLDVMHCNELLEKEQMHQNENS